MSQIPPNLHLVIKEMKEHSYYKEDLQMLLMQLCAFGMPVLHRMEHGWWLVLRMHVSAAGTEFKVSSEILPTPIEAARQCAQRAIQTIHEWSPPSSAIRYDKRPS